MRGTECFEITVARRLESQGLRDCHFSLSAKSITQFFTNAVVVPLDPFEFLLRVRMKGVVHRLYRARNLFITSSPGIGVTVPSSISLSRRSASSAQSASILL